MADVQPFRALRYSAAAVSDLSLVVAPPYDVISPAEQAALHARDRHNVIRLELGEVLPEDSPTNNRYTRAGATLEEWLGDHVVAQDRVPAYYAYEQGFAYDGRRLTRRGFFAAVRLQPWHEGAVLPHEKTLARPKADRLELLRATRTNVSPVFSLYHDPSGDVAGAFADLWTAEPLMACIDTAGDTHRVWALADPERCQRIAAALGAVPLYIADGHHRYETALAYHEEQCAQQHGEHTEEAARVLMALVAADDAGLLVLPTHRLIANLPPDRLAALDGALRGALHVEELPPSLDADALLARLRQAGEGDGQVFVLAGPGERLRLLRPRSAAGSMDAVAVPQALRDLDVWQAHHVVLERILGLDAASAAREEHLRYTRDAAAARAAVREGSAQLALLLNPTPPGAIMQVADAGATMPQKSTYFYPKLITGLIMRLLH